MLVRALISAYHFTGRHLQRFRESLTTGLQVFGETGINREQTTMRKRNHGLLPEVRRGFR